MFEFHVLWTKVETNICYSIPKEYTRNQKKLLKIFVFSTIFVIVSTDMRIAGTEWILMLCRKLFKMVH